MMTRPSSPRPWVVSLAAWVAVSVGLVTAAVVVMLRQDGPSMHPRSKVVACTAPALPGQVVDVRLLDMDMSLMMRTGQAGWRQWHAGMMGLTLNPTSVRAGSVSLRVTNAGVVTHEVVVLPLSPGMAVGTRRVDPDGTVDELTSVGEASDNCGSSYGDGILPGSSGWVTLTLPAGRYELVCNLPGHYASGMRAELDVLAG